MFIVVGILKFLFVVVCLLLIGAILLQSGKGGDVSAAFGGAGAQSAFGPRGATKPLEKASIYLGLTFMVLALLFSLPGFNGNLSVVKSGSAVTTATPAPAPSPEASPAASATPAASPEATPAAKAEEKKPEAKAEAKPATKESAKEVKPSAPEKK